MRVTMFCKDESVAPWKSKLGAEHKPLVLLLDDQAAEDPMRELVELRIEEEEDKTKWSGKVKGRLVTIGVHRIGKFNGIARFEGKVVSVSDGPKR